MCFCGYKVVFLDAAAISEIQVLIRSLEQLSLIGDIQHGVLELLVNLSSH